MSYHVENPRFKELPEQLIVREDGYMDAYKNEGVPIVDYVYTLGGGECEWELEHSGTLYDKWRCSKCKFLFVEPRCDQGYMDLEPNFCPKCGIRIRKAVGR